MGYRPPKGMNPPQLEGKRTGRPVGSRNHAKAWADIQWAYDNLDEDCVEAPNQNALMWWRFGNTFPDQFRCWVDKRGRILTRRDIEDWDDLENFDEY
jgi:hypothetical protein